MIPNTRYGRGFLVGRIDGYRRGTMSLVHVAGAAALAKRCGVEEADITDLLHAFGLQWDAGHQAVIKKPS